MKLSKKQEKAIETALDILCVILSHELKTDKYKLIEESIEELTKMRDKSINVKAREKSKKEYTKNLFENSDFIELDGKWFRENIINK